MSATDMDNEIEYLLSQEVRNLCSGLQFKTFVILNYFDPKSTTTQSFDHFKCMICQVEIMGRQTMIFHSKCPGACLTFRLLIRRLKGNHKRG